MSPGRGSLACTRRAARPLPAAGDDGQRLAARVLPDRRRRRGHERRREHVRVVQRAELVLQVAEPLEQRRRTGDDLGHRLEEIAQPLRDDARAVRLELIGGSRAPPRATSRSSAIFARARSAIAAAKVMSACSARVSTGAS